MDPRVSVLISAVDGTGNVFRTVDMVRRGKGVTEILVLCNPSLSTVLVDRLKAAFGVECVLPPHESPGAVRNFGLEAASGDLVMFIEAGDSIDSRYVHLACGALSASPNLTFVTSWARKPGANGLLSLVQPIITLDKILGDPDMVPRPTLFRRSAWEGIGRFDETLPSHDWYDFWIRVLDAGYQGKVIEEALISHESTRNSAYRKRLNPDRYAAGLRTVFEKHANLFRRYVASVLCDREVGLRAMSARYKRILRQRDQFVVERSDLRNWCADTDRRLYEFQGNTTVDWGDLRRVLPVSPDWGYERGTPIDRYYIERFLEAHAADVKGTVLEIQEPDYTRRFGRDRVFRSDVIDVDVDNKRANLTGDLRHLAGIPSDTYDCFILTQTTHVIDDMASVLHEAIRILKPGGVLLLTLPAASRVCLEYGPDGDFWRVTEAGARRLMAGLLPSSHVEIQSFGNVLTNIAFLEGLACHEVSTEEFEIHDPFYPLLVGVRALKPVIAPPDSAGVVSRRESDGRAVILLYHRIAEPKLDIHNLSITPGVFREQMLHVKENYQPMPLAELAAAVREGWLPQSAVAVTFDDGYLDNLENASPILTELGVPATFFVTSAPLMGVGEFWWDILALVFFGPFRLPVRLEIMWQGEKLAASTETEEGRQRAHWLLYHRVREATAEGRAEIMGIVKEWANLPENIAPRIMNREELRNLAGRPGHSIGGHGTHHLSYSAHAQDIICRDVRENRILLESSLGRIVSSFAYPFGDYNNRAVEMVEDSGYRAAVTCEWNVVRPGMDPLRLPRVAVSSTDAAGFDEQLRTLFSNPEAVSG